MSRRLNKPDTQADIDLRDYLQSKTCFVVVAGAGSGKTTSLIKALKFIDENEGSKLRQEGKRIACITYTTTAEKEILDDVGHDAFFHVSTIHSFLWELIRPFQANIQTWVTRKIQAKIEKLVADREGFSDRVRQPTRDRNEADTFRYREMATLIGGVKEFRYETGSNYTDGILGHNDIIDMVPELINTNRLLQTIVAEKYPYFFIDESQDTIPGFIVSMKLVAANVANFCLGFFGDPMQKIYMTGAGAITLEEGWKQIDKPENFRCSTSVLDVVNNIRAGGDSLRQTGGRKEYVDGALVAVEGYAALFVLKADEHREEKISRVRAYLSATRNDASWTSDAKEADVKILVIEHRMAAKRLGFGDLYAAFNDNSTESMSTGFREATLWAVQPFIKFVVPLVLAVQDNRQFEVIELLRRFCLLLQSDYLQMPDLNPKTLLNSLKEHVKVIAELMNSETATVKEVLNYLREQNLLGLDERLSSRLTGDTVLVLDDNDETGTRTDEVIARYFDIPAAQLLGYQIYINDESAYSTQHSIKGAEFERVMVVLDDEEGNSNSYSYDKLFGIAPLSATDEDNIAAGRDSTLGRTRRLLYVCCSRSLKDLAVILFVGDVAGAVASLEGSGIFTAGEIKTDADI
jgi:DNA helicase-2/ATP-dependent DNA helicase PcrA